MNMKTAALLAAVGLSASCARALAAPPSPPVTAGPQTQAELNASVARVQADAFAQERERAQQREAYLAEKRERETARHEANEAARGEAEAEAARLRMAEERKAAAFDLAARMVAAVRADVLASVLICEAKERVAAAKKEIADERAAARHSGAVDKAVLHDAGVAIAEAERDIAENTKGIRQLKKSPTTCDKLAKDWGACMRDPGSCGEVGRVVSKSFHYLWADYTPVAELHGPHIVDGQRLAKRASDAITGAGSW